MSTYEGGEELEGRQEEPAILGRTRLLDIQLREGHEVPVRKPVYQPASIQRADARRGHHDHVGNDAEETRDPQARPPPELGGGYAGGAGADEGAERHEGGDELLAGRGDVPADRGGGVLVAVDLAGEGR